MEKPTIKICYEKTIIMSKPILGIIGGGQLGSLLSVAAKKLEIKTVKRTKLWKNIADVNKFKQTAKLF